MIFPGTWGEWRTVKSGAVPARDHRGRAVYLDVEGRGVVACALPGVHLIVDGWPAPAPKAAFAREAMAVGQALGDGHVYACVGSFSLPTEGVEPVAATNPCGAGWVVGSSDRFEVDDRQEPQLDASADWPIPFWSHVKGEVQVIQTHPYRVVLLDRWTPDDLFAKPRRIEVQNMSDIETLESTFANGAPRTAAVAYHLNAMHLTLEVPEGAVGLMLRRTGDRFFGRQRARVLINGEARAIWYDGWQDRARRWFVSTLPLPLDKPASSGSVRLSIDPPAGSPLFSFSELEAFAVMGP